MSNSIGVVNDLVAVIRNQLERQAPAAKPARAKAARSTPGNRYASEQLAGLIALRVRQIGKDDADRGRKAFRIFLEVVLLSHFGDALMNDPKFFQMVDDVQRAMEADPDMSAMVTQAIEHLLSQQI